MCSAGTGLLFKATERAVRRVEHKEAAYCMRFSLGGTGIIWYDTAPHCTAMHQNSSRPTKRQGGFQFPRGYVTNAE
jgi:hypothetical protein